MRGRARSKKIEDLILKFTSNKDQRRPVSESRVTRTRRRSQLVEALACKFEKSPARVSNAEISEVLHQPRIAELQADAVQPFLETRSQIGPGETAQDEDARLTYTVAPVYPEQIYFNRVRVTGEALRSQREQRTGRFGAYEWSKLDESELAVSVSPVKEARGKKLISQSSIGNRIKEGVFVAEADTEELLRARDSEFVDRMRDTQGNAIQKMKHSFLNQDDRVLRRKLLDALRKKFKGMIVKDNTVEELRRAYEQKAPAEKKVRNWMALARSVVEGESKQTPISQIGKVSLETEQR